VDHQSVDEREQSARLSPDVQVGRGVTGLLGAADSLGDEDWQVVAAFDGGGQLRLDDGPGEEGDPHGRFGARLLADRQQLAQQRRQTARSLGGCSACPTAAAIRASTRSLSVRNAKISMSSLVAK
jgi:hypothetical protein